MAWGDEGGGDWWGRNQPRDDGSGIDAGNGGFTGTGNGGTVPLPTTVIPGQSFPANEVPGNPAAPTAPAGSASNVNIDQIKALVGSDYSQAHLQQILPQLKALGVEVQNQERGDLRPRFLLPGGEQWDFGPGGWINSGHGVQAGFGAGGSSSGGGGGASGGSNGGILDTLRNTPGYQFTLQQGLQGVERSAFAKGTGLTGGTLKALMQYGSGLADSTYGSQVDRYYRGAQLGANSVNQQSQ